MYKRIHFFQEIAPLAVTLVFAIDPERTITVRFGPVVAVDPSEGPYFVYADRLQFEGHLATVTAADLGRMLSGTITPLGHGLYRVDP